MGLHDDLIADSVAIHAATFGDTVVYTPPAGQPQTPTEIIAIVGAEMSERRPTENGYETVRTRTFEAITDEDNEGFCGVVDINDNGTITYDETVYGIERRSESTTAGTVVLHCISRKAGRRVREGSRVSR
jgi:hypothetical protein